MGRGISIQQKQILGLACSVASIHGLPIGRGQVSGVEQWFLHGEPCDVAGTVMEGCELADVTQPLCVHLVWNVPLATQVCIEWEQHGYRSERWAMIPGNFDNKAPGVKSAKVAASKALRRLCERDLLRLRHSGRSLSGYVLTQAGFEIGKEHRVEIPSKLLGKIKGDKLRSWLSIH